MASALIAASACTQKKESHRSECVRNFISDQTILRNGAAVFDDIDGASRQHGASFRAQLGLIFNISRPAASLTKPIAAHEVRKLVDASKIRMDANLPQLLAIESEQLADRRAASITLLDLLRHTAGFDRSVSSDPLWRRDNTDYGEPSCSAASAYALKKPLDYTPGKRVAYSNVGYCLLGRVLALNGIDLSSPTGPVVSSPLGAAGGWVSSPKDLHARLVKTLPLTHLPVDAPNLGDGSHYDYGWRHWPHETTGPKWAHFGNLPGLLTIAVTDGHSKVLIAYFDGDPTDVGGLAGALYADAWKCMSIPD